MCTKERGQDTGPQNTSVTLTSDGTGRFLVGDRTVFYNRLSLADIFATNSDPIEKTDELNSVADVIAVLNVRYGLNLQAADFTISDWPTWVYQPNETHTLTLTPNASHLVYNAPGSIQIRLLQVSLEQAIPNNSLNGLTYTPPAP